MLNKSVLQRKCKLIAEDLERLRPLGARSFEEVVKDPVAFAAVERYLERVVTRAIDINRHLIAELGIGEERIRGYEDTFRALASLGVYDEAFAKRIAPSAGLRNRLVHEYNDTDPKIIFRSVGDALAQYAAYCQAVLNFLDTQP